MNLMSSARAAPGENFTRAAQKTAERDVLKTKVRPSENHLPHAHEIEANPPALAAGPPMGTPDVLPLAPGAERNSHLAVFVPPPLAEAPNNAEERKGELEFEIGHVLFIDIVGYTKLLNDEQSERLLQLNEIVRGTRQFRRAESAGKLIRLPTGDGMALVFRHSPEAPAQCALEISGACQLPLRMGIHSGPVNHVADVNERINVAGAGINIAQRVMDCGDAGHILMSKHVAEDLEHSARWQPHLHDLGQYEVKHGGFISVVNLFTSELGNPAVPTKLAASNRPSRLAAVPRRARPYTLALGALLFIAAVIAAQEYLWMPGRPATTSILPASPASDAPPILVAPEKSIAVLPFENLSANQETAFFTDGVQDEILTNLAKVADLRVTSRTSVMQYRNLARRNLREIGRQLGVAHIVEGSVQRIGNRIRVNAQFIDARTDAHVWAQTYDRDLADVFAIQSEIAKTIAEQLQANLSPKEKAEIDQKPTNDLEAYDLYLRAMQANRARASSIGSGGVEEAKEETRLLEAAIDRDPAFVPALAQLSQTHLYLYWVNADQPATHLEAAKRALETAAKLQPDAGGVHLARALLYYWGARDYERALAELALARRAFPNETRGLFITAMIERRQGDWDKSTRHIEEVYALDPFNITVISELAGINYSALRRYGDATKMLDNALAWRPRNFALSSLRANVDLAWKADLHRWQEVLGSEVDTNADAGDLANARIDLALREHDYAKADHLLGENSGTESDDNGFFTPREWKRAIAARGLGNDEQALALFALARARVATAAQARPDDAKSLIVLAQLEAALGEKETALRDGERAVALLPIEKDSINGPQLLARLASIYAQLGDNGRALDLLDRGARQPYGPTFGSLRLDLMWDPLRKDARFEKLLVSIAPKN